MNFQPIIGLEVHVELKTNSKMFCGCSASYFGEKPNTHCCPVCLGLPGALPVPNQKAIEWCVMIGLALNCKIPLSSKFDRKNYFYPDLPKGYQISQYDEPFCVNGSASIKKTQRSETLDKKIAIRRVHMEEDTGKLIHGAIQGKPATLIDFNRSGVPLVEIVTEPDFGSAFEVTQYLQKLQQIVRYLGVSDADMEKGNMRLEPNISLKTPTDKGLPSYKVEVKNINSFKFVEKAITYEIERQKTLLEQGEKPKQETRGWNEKRQITVSQRVKEEASDYRYFPEPDIPPIRWTEKDIEKIKNEIPELPEAKFERFQKDFGLPAYDAEILTREKAMAEYFEESRKVGARHNILPKQIANTIINKKIDISAVLPAELIAMIIASKQTSVIDDDALQKTVKEVLLANPKAVQDYKNGKESAIMFLMGQVLKKLGGKADVNIIKQCLIKEINNL